MSTFPRRVGTYHLLIQRRGRIQKSRMQRLRGERGPSRTPETGIMCSSDTKTKGRKVAPEREGKWNRESVREEISSWLASSVGVTLHRSGNSGRNAIFHGCRRAGSLAETGSGIGERVEHVPRRNKAAARCVSSFDKKISNVIRIAIERD